MRHVALVSAPLFLILLAEIAIRNTSVCEIKLPQLGGYVSGIVAIYLTYIIHKVFIRQNSAKEKMRDIVVDKIISVQAKVCDLYENLAGASPESYNSIYDKEKIRMTFIGKDINYVELISREYLCDQSVSLHGLYLEFKRPFFEKIDPSRNKTLDSDVNAPFDRLNDSMNALVIRVLKYNEI